MVSDSMVFFNPLRIVWGFPGGSVGEEYACNAGDEGRHGFDSQEGGMVTHSSILAWRIPWAEEPGGPQSMGVTKSRTRVKQLSTHACTQGWCCRERSHINDSVQVL